MKKISMLLVLLGLAFAAGAQGIHFESGTWNEVRERAKRERKLIYMDIYTTWCGPCKVMAAQVFPDAEVGKRYNEQFVNFKIDAEKGEGLKLATQYQVDGYPTNLYIDPETEQVVYRVMGSTDIPAFLNRADIAATEQKDPLKWKDYEDKYRTGNWDKAFLVAFLDKADRLSMPNDAMLNSYVEKYVSTRPDDSTLKFLVHHTQTLDNKSVDLIFTNRARVNKLNPEPESFFEAWISGKPYSTLEKAVTLKDEKLLTLIDESIKKYHIRSGMPGGMYFYRKEYFNKTGNDQKAWEASMAEADYLTALPADVYAAMDKDAMTNTQSSILYQLKGMKVPEEKWESSIKATLDAHPEMQKSSTMSAASSLNETAWKVFERKRTDKKALTMAIAWSEKSLKMAENTDSWPLFADTYASLLYANGNKDKAIVKEEEAIKKAEERKVEGGDALKESLKKMKEGTL